jgi:hypothetical protein
MSDTYVASIGVSRNVHPDFGSGLWDGGPIGIPYDAVGAGQPTKNGTFDYDEESDHVPYPIPADPSIEGGPSSSGDRHVIIVDYSSCTLYELYAAYPTRGPPATQPDFRSFLDSFATTKSRADRSTTRSAYRSAQRPQLPLAGAPPSRCLELEPPADGSPPSAETEPRRLLVPTRRPSDLAGDEDLRRHRRGQRLAVVHLGRSGRALGQRRTRPPRCHPRFRLRGGRRIRADGGRQLRPSRRLRSRTAATRSRAVGQRLTAVHCRRRSAEPVTNRERIRSGAIDDVCPGNRGGAAAYRLRRRS